MSKEGIRIVTPDEDSLSSIKVNVSCPQGCMRTFANSSALRFHITQFHHQKKVPSSKNEEVWYHCPVASCIYHCHFGHNGKHFPKLKYLKQHYLKVHAKRSHKCNCGQTFSTLALLSHHQRVCGLQLLCGCGRSFSSLETLQTHARRLGHTLHSSTVQAVRERRAPKDKPASQQQPIHAQTVWHQIPLKYQSIEDIGLGKVDIKTTIASSATPARIMAVPPIFTQTSGGLLHTTTSFSQMAHLHPQQPTHLLAAIALSELAATAMKSRVVSVDVGVQTESKSDRQSQKASSQNDGWTMNDSTLHILQGLNKRKRTAETQTRLTHKDSKRLNVGCQLNKGNAENESHTNYLDDSNDDDEASLGSLTLQVDLPEFITTQQSSSGTQTSPRASGLTHSQLHNLTISLFDRACGEDEPGIPSPSVTSITSTQTPEHLDPFTTSQLLIEDDEDLLSVVGETPSVGSTRPPPLAHIRSSSIETQTDHDVLLSKNAEAPEDADEIILAHTETQTDPNNLLISAGTTYEGPGTCQVSGPCQGHDSDSIWCSIETQTCEDFSDIEQFMCSTIHTQTPDHSHDELFPELSFTHTQTQTSLEDPPALVTTHTQTPKRRQPYSGLP